jgi:hypothetical protein
MPNTIRIDNPLGFGPRIPVPNPKKLAYAAEAYYLQLRVELAATEVALAVTRVVADNVAPGQQEVITAEVYKFINSMVKNPSSSLPHISLCY